VNIHFLPVFGYAVPQNNHYTLLFEEILYFVDQAFENVKLWIIPVRFRRL